VCENSRQCAVKVRRQSFLDWCPVFWWTKRPSTRRLSTCIVQIGSHNKRDPWLYCWKTQSLPTKTFNKHIPFHLAHLWVEHCVDVGWVSSFFFITKHAIVSTLHPIAMLYFQRVDVQSDLSLTASTLHAVLREVFYRSRTKCFIVRPWLLSLGEQQWEKLWRLRRQAMSCDFWSGIVCLCLWRAAAAVNYLCCCLSARYLNCVYSGVLGMIADKVSLDK